MEEEPTREIPKEIETLTQSIKELQARVECLGEKISPVLTPLTRTTAKEEKLKVVEPTSAIGLSVRQQSDKVFEVVSTINHLIRSVEL